MVSSEDVNGEGWSSPWAQRIERTRRSVLDVILERQEAARGRAYRRRRLAKRLALVALAGVLASAWVPYGWVPFWLGVAAGSRAVWLWVFAAGDAFEGALDARNYIESEPD